MADYIINENTLTDIADAIRRKTGEGKSIPTGQMANRINNLAVEDGAGVILPELTNEGTTNDLLSGKQLIDSQGNIINGTATLQTKSVTPTKESQKITPDKSYIGLKEVVVNPIPNNYIIPQGALDITENGEYDVTNKSKVNVAINVNTCYVSTSAPDPSIGLDNDIYIVIEG